MGIHILTRPYEDSASMSIELEEGGVWCFIEPMIEIQYSNRFRKELHEILHENPAAIIITSRHSLNILQDNSEISQPFYVVGNETARIAAEMGFDVMLVAADAASLEAMIPDHVKQELILYISGEDVSSNFKSLTNMRRVVSYRAMAQSEFTREFISGLKKGDFSSISFFSERTAEIFVSIGSEIEIIEEVKKLHFFCISKKVADIFTELGFEKVSYAKLPERGDMINLILDFNEN